MFIILFDTNLNRARPLFTIFVQKQKFNDNFIISNIRMNHFQVVKSCQRYCYHR